MRRGTGSERGAAKSAGQGASQARRSWEKPSRSSRVMTPSARRRRRARLMLERDRSTMTPGFFLSWKIRFSSAQNLLDARPGPDRRWMYSRFRRSM